MYVRKIKPGVHKHVASMKTSAAYNAGAIGKKWLIRPS